MHFQLYKSPYRYLNANQLQTFNLKTHTMRTRLLGVVTHQLSSPFKTWMTLVRIKMVWKHKFDYKRETFSTRWNQYLFTLQNNALFICLSIALFKHVSQQKLKKFHWYFIDFCSILEITKKSHTPILSTLYFKLQS